LTSGGAEEARAVLRMLQELIDARDLDGLLELFAGGGVLIGTSARTDPSGGSRSA
jgi:copper homeostasis protein CutC